MSFALAVMGLFVGAGLIGTLVYWLTIRCTGVPVEKVTVFFGRELVTVPVGKAILAVGWIPTGGSVKYDIPRFRQLPLVLRLATLLSGPCGVLLVALLLLGAELMWHHFATGFGQLILGAIHPKTEGVPLLTQLHQLFTASPAAFAGVCLTKFAACVFLPWGASPAMLCLRELFDPEDKRPWFSGLQSLTAIALLAMVASWGFALWWQATL